MEEYLERRREYVGTQMRTYMDNYFANDPEYMKLDDAGRDAFVARYNIRDGGRVGYQTGGISVGGLPGFAISTGLDLLSRPPQGGLLSTVALSAKEPFNRLQAEQAAAGMTKSERDFQTSLFEKGEEFIECVFERIYS